MTDLQALARTTTGQAARIRVPAPTTEGFIPQLPSLDGMRGVAVLLVIAYHLGYERLAGGFLGVEMFFVVSGYLITSLLVAEIDRTGRLDIAGFWARRLRRLVPAVVVLLGTLAVAVPLVAPDAVSQLRSDVPASLAYMTNWWFIAADRSYFEVAGRPELLQHLWSLAIEEQFYLLWPPLVIVALRWSGRRRWVVPAVTAGAALASTAWMAALHDPAADTARVYFGTDTRASALLVGATLAFLWPPDLTKRALNPPAALADLSGVAGVVVVAWAVLNLNGFDPPVYRGGFLLCSVATALVITAATTPGTLLQPALSHRALRWVGLRSYGLYLWHWPIIQLTRPRLDLPLHGFRLVVLQLVLIFGAAELSWRLVEQPLRRPRTSGWGLAAERYRRARWAVVAAAPLMLAVYLLPAGSSAPVAASPEREAPATTPPATTPPATSPPATAPPAPGPTVVGGPHATAVPVTEPPATTAAPVTGDELLLVGDSIMLGARDELLARFPGADVDAEVGRQLRNAPELVAELRDAGRLRPVVVVHLGSNGSATASQLAALMEVLDEVRTVVFVNSTAPRPWTSLVNDRLRDLADPDAGVHLLDWNAVVGDERHLVGSDGTHLAPAGARRFAEVIDALLSSGR